VFRRESGRLISVLTRLFGPHNLQLAEDVVQASFVAALETWGKTGIPDNPAAWLLTTARRRAIDAIRRERTRRTFAADLTRYLDGEWTLTTTVREAFGEDLVRDDQLRMIFMCCHPGLGPENQLTLILRTLCGLSVPATARALVTTEATVLKRMVRIRQRLKGVDFALPRPEHRPAVLETTHTALYLLFNENHLSTGEEPIRSELCRDAMYLTQLLADEPALCTSNTLALLALMCLHAARLDSRIDAEKKIVPLDRQDRSRWDRALIVRGTSAWSGRAAWGRSSRAATISRRRSPRATARPRVRRDRLGSICSLYDRLLDVAPSPLTELNRAVAVSYRDGPETALPLVEGLRSGQLAGSHAVAAVLANLYARTGAEEESRLFLEEALASARTRHERRLIALQVGRARDSYAGGSKTG
jgi:RNA polymerase sigma-70 factor (ECF subfamily)